MEASEGTANQASLEKTILLGKTAGGRKRERPNVRGNDSIKETLGRSIQELRGPMRMSLIRRPGVRAD